MKNICRVSLLLLLLSVPSFADISLPLYGTACTDHYDSHVDDYVADLRASWWNHDPYCGPIQATQHGVGYKCLSSGSDQNMQSGPFDPLCWPNNQGPNCCLCYYRVSPQPSITVATGCQKVTSTLFLVVFVCAR